MWVILGIIAAALIIIAIDVPYLWKKGWTRELWIFSIVLVCGIALNVAQFALQIQLPNPLDAIIFVYTPLSHWILGMLGQ